MKASFDGKSKLLNDIKKKKLYLAAIYCGRDDCVENVPRSLLSRGKDIPRFADYGDQCESNVLRRIVNVKCASKP